MERSGSQSQDLVDVDSVSLDAGEADLRLEVDGGRDREPGAEVPRPLELQKAGARRTAVVVTPVGSDGSRDLTGSITHLEPILASGAPT